MRIILVSATEAKLVPPFVNYQQGLTMHIALTEIGHEKIPSPALTDRAIGYGFFNDNIRQGHQRSISMIFYWSRDRVRQGKFLVYRVAGEKNLAEHSTKNHPTSHHRSKQITDIVPTSDTSNHVCYMAPNQLQGCVESIPTRGYRDK